MHRLFMLKLKYKQSMHSILSTKLLCPVLEMKHALFIPYMKTEICLLMQNAYKHFSEYIIW